MKSLTENQLLIIDKSLGLYQTGIEAVIAGIVACKLVDITDPVYTAYWDSQNKLLAEVTLIRLLFLNERELPVLKTRTTP